MQNKLVLISYKTIFLSLVAFISLFTVAACERKQSIGKDGYYFEKETMERTSMQVDVVLLKSQKEMEAALLSAGGKVDSKREVAAFAIYSVKEPKCTIYMLDARIRYEPEFIGHEFAHCVYGQWHVKQK